MTLINLNFIQFYQSFIKADLVNKKPSIMSIDNVFIICEERYAFRVLKFNDEWSESLNNFDLSEILDSIDSSSTNILDLLFYKHILNLKGTESYVEGNIRRLRFL